MQKYKTFLIYTSDVLFFGGLFDILKVNLFKNLPFQTKRCAFSSCNPSIFEEGDTAGYVRGLVEGKAAVPAEALGEMGEPCEDCPAVEVTKGTKTIRLYNPDKVEFKKE